ncbi:MAG: HIT domain-containing protein, partial [Desulfosporosinus sp.]|nr:HIT domain-containing protein [Desulfosporosinus sp.]
MADCLFCTLPVTDIILENERALAFYDKFPVNEGHVLIVPKRHVVSLF